MRKKTALLALLAFGSCAAVVSCGDDDGGGNPEPPDAGAAGSSDDGGAGGTSGGASAKGGSDAGGTGGASKGGTTSGGAGGVSGDAGTAVGGAGGVGGNGGVGGDAGAAAGTGGVDGGSGGADAGSGGWNAGGGAGADGGFGGNDGACPSTEVTVEHAFRGAYNSSAVVTQLAQPWKVTGGTHQVRQIFAGEASIDATRAYFTFDLSGVAGDVTGATLRLTHPTNSYDSPDASETVTLFDVTTSSGELESVASGESGDDLDNLDRIFDDLGAGVVFGSFEATLASNGTVESVVLSVDALSSLNAAAGSTWTVGAALTTPGGATTFGQNERVLRGTGAATAATELVLTICEP